MRKIVRKLLSKKFINPISWMFTFVGIVIKMLLQKEHTG